MNKNKLLVWIAAMLCVGEAVAGQWLNAASPYVINMNEVVGDGEGYHIDSGKVTLTSSGASYLITGSGVETSLAVSVPSGVEVSVTLSNVNINVSGLEGVPAFGMASGALAQIRLAADNTLVGGDLAAGLQVPQGALVNLSSDPSETGSLLAVGGGCGAGIGSGYGQNAGTVMIGGGGITAEGGVGGAGIGGGMWQWPAMTGGGGGSVVISGGTVVATGSHAAAGVGDGEGGDGADITISGGAVTACGGNSGGACIGGDRWGGVGNVSISGGVIDARGGGGQGEGIGEGTEAGRSTVHVAGFISGSNTYVLANTIGSGILRQGGLIFENGYGRLYEEDVTLTASATIPVGTSVVVTNAQTFIVGAGAALTNNGTINTYGTLVIEGALINNGTLRAYDGFDVGGTVVNNGVAYSIEPIRGGGAVAGGTPVFVGEAGSVAVPVAVNINAVAAGGPGYTFDGGCLTFFWRGHYLVYGTGESTANRILISEDTATCLTLSNVIIRVPANYVSAFDVRVTASVTIMLAGTNALSSGLGAAGLHVPPGASVAIGTHVSASGERQAGSLDAAGGASSAGIGGHLYESAGSVAISGGAVTARGGGSAGIYGGAGIGGGHGGNGGSVLISGGTVIATGNYNAAAIGGGSGGSPATGSISGNACVIANTVVAGLARLGGVIVEHAAGGLCAGAVAVVADTSFPEGNSLVVTDGQTLVIGRGVTFINSGVITNAGAIIVYGTFINNGQIVGNAPQQCEVPSGVIEHLAMRPDAVVLSWPTKPAPISVIYGKEKMTDEWAELSIASSSTNAVMALGRFRFFTRSLP